MIDAAEDALLQAGEPLYQRGNAIVRVVRRPSQSVRHYRRFVPGTLIIVGCEKPYLVEAMTRAARWRRWDKRTDKEVAIDAPDKIAIGYLSRTGEWRLPPLWAVITAPTLRPDGTLLQEPGYDEPTATLYDPCGVEFPRVPEHPDRAAAEEALFKLHNAFASFPFVDDVDKSVMIALSLSALVRRSLPSAPLGAFTAPAARSGKTMLADGISIMANGVAAPAMSYPSSDEEAAKAALSVLMEGDPVVLIDNIERPLQGDWLCSILTSEVFRARLLGRNEMISVPTITTFLATGNHLVVAGDMSSRTLLCRIDPQCENPEQREFQLDFRQWMSANRPELVAAGLTLMRAYVCSGERVDMPPWGGFEAWSDRVRAPLVWLGDKDPCASLRTLERDDPGRESLLKLIAAWQSSYADKPVTTAQAIKDCESSAVYEQLRDVLKEVAGDRAGQLNAQKLGQWLRHHSDRIVDGKQFVRRGQDHHATLWTVARPTA